MLINDDPMAGSPVQMFGDCDTGQKNNQRQLNGGKMVSTTRPSRPEPSSVIRGPESKPATEVASAPVEAIEYEEELPGNFRELAADSAPAHEESAAGRIAQGIIAFYDWLSGPAMSDRDRLLRKIRATRPRRYP